MSEPRPITTAADFVELSEAASYPSRFIVDLMTTGGRWKATHAIVSHVAKAVECGSAASRLLATIEAARALGQGHPMPNTCPCQTCVLQRQVQSLETVNESLTAAIGEIKRDRDKWKRRAEAAEQQDHDYQPPRGRKPSVVPLAVDVSDPTRDR